MAKLPRERKCYQCGYWHVGGNICATCKEKNQAEYRKGLVRWALHRERVPDFVKLKPEESHAR